MPKDRFRAKPFHKNTSTNFEARLEREDDQIAPKAAAQSIDALQKWALYTANITQGSHRKNETRTLERIQDRYANGSFSPGYPENVDQDAVSAKASQKLKRPISPTDSLQLDIVHSDYKTSTGERHAKRRRSRSPEIGRFNKEDDHYAHSSDRSFLSEVEVIITKEAARKDTRTRT